MSEKQNPFPGRVVARPEGYKSFLPAGVNCHFSWSDPRISVLLEEAVRFLGELNAYSKLIPDVGFFIKMHVVKEATLSSRIEGTQATLDEALSPREELTDPERRNDWDEIQNYIEAMDSAIVELKDLPLSVRLLRNAHKKLLNGVRGYCKEPGEIRRSQNWIGGSSLRDAAFIPPHHEEVAELLGDLERFWHNESIQVPHLIKVALSHYQFETIHPFLDGNGRIGRLLITLHLVSLGILQQPTLYISAYLEKHRAQYYDALSRVRESGDVEQWLRFFLEGVTATARDSRSTLEKIISLRGRYDDAIAGVFSAKRQQQARKLLLYLFGNPVATISEMAKILGVTFATASALAQELSKIGILSERTGQKKNRIFSLREYLSLFDK